ncbi:hypothetical protein A3E41_02195 [Candidatus Woesebacteria bacterium RIFCSPHIGHO2_12_FULL_38_9]|nr:MAG: hypothetical protein A3E41_02195 [Candidatus Woesebacteria bacterium RIFCSPHIGHO2_12_FULL_38_9]
MKTAIVYDRVNKWGGAERVLLTLHELFPDAPIYTSVYSPEKATWAKVFPEVIPSFLQNIPCLRDKHEYLAPFMPIAFESLNLTRSDLVISVTSEAAKGVITKPGTLHVCYCLTPTRYLWSHFDTYFSARGGPAFGWKGITKPVVTYLRSWDKIAAQRPDVVIAISTAVQDRIKKYYNRGSEIIYPPVDIEKFQRKSVDTTSLRSDVVKQRRYFLIVSRLVPYKKVDLAIEAFNELGLPLVVVGTGSEEKKYKFKYKFKNIIFKGFVDDEELVSLYCGARALIMPQEEDFGIVAVEAQAAGCPVIAYAKGGASDTVINSETGVLFDTQSKNSLCNAVNTFNLMIFDRDKLIKNAEKFSTRRFKKEFVDLINIKV